jgi:hypothetical protein
MIAYDHKLIFNLGLVIGHAEHRTKTCGFLDNGKTASVLRAAFVTWIVACEEARAQLRTGNPSADFLNQVINALPDLDDPTWEQTNSDGFHSSLKYRMKSLWGIRIAFTHSDGDTAKICNTRNRTWAESAHLHINGVTMKSGQIDMSGADLHYIATSFAQLQTVLM